MDRYMYPSIQVNPFHHRSVHDIPCFSLRDSYIYTAVEYKRWSPSVKCLCLLLPTAGPPSPDREEQAQQSMVVPVLLPVVSYYRGCCSRIPHSKRLRGRPVRFEVVCLPLPADRFTTPAPLSDIAGWASIYRISLAAAHPHRREGCVPPTTRMEP